MRSPTILRQLTIVCIAFAFSFATPALAQEDVAAESPAVTVDRLHDTLLESMRRADELGYDGRVALLRPTLEDTYDLEFMAEKSIGRHWRKLEPDAQAQWRDAFAGMLTANYAGRFVGYTGQSFQTEGEEPAAHETKVVRTVLLNPSGDDVQLNYRLRRNESGWRIVDIYLNGTVSELALRRSEYGSMLKREGFDALLSSVVEKTQQLASAEAPESPDPTP